MSDTSIEVSHLSLDLRVRGGRSALKNLDANVGAHLTDTSSRAATVRALDDVSFTVRRGEALAIIGRNGSGKSTLMRVLAGIYAPTSGTCRIDGRVTTLFTNQLGVNYNGSGIENVRLMGILLGLPRNRINALIEDAAEFSELGEYLNMPLRVYSAGMRTRLGFGVATGVDPDILLIDEVFGTGDQQFQAKARERMTRLLAKAGTTLMASHSIGVLREFCSAALWLDRGRVRMLGSFDEVHRAYGEAIPSGEPRTTRLLAGADYSNIAVARS